MDLWQKWEHHHHLIGLSSQNPICPDGIINKQAFFSSTPKILFILKEVNNAPGLDLRKYINTKPKYQMWHTIAKWSTGFFYNFPPYHLISEDQKNDSIKKIAVINLKKVSGNASSSMSVIGAYALRDRELLKEQISTINPDIIIGCGVFEILLWLLELNVHPEAPLSHVVKSLKYNCWVFPSRHPNRANETHYNNLKQLSKKIL